MKRVCNFTIIFAAVFGTNFALPSVESSKLTKLPSLWKTLDGSRPKIYAHRGEKVLMPEHTIPAYEFASILGADFVEPDLCLTKDNQLVCFHDLELGSGTDVNEHPEFDHLKHNTTHGYDWYIRNFTLAQLKTLRVVQKKAGIRPQYLNNFTIPTFSEYLDTVHRMSFKLNRTIGVIPELKSPAFHNAQRAVNGMEQQVLLALASYGYPINSKKGNCSAILEEDGSVHDIKCPPVIIQCFEFPPLEYLKGHAQSVKLLYLAEQDHALLTYKGMEQVAAVAQHYTTWKEYAYSGVEAELLLNNATWNVSLVDSMGGFVKPEEFVSEAHRLGMKFGVYTIYDSREPSLRGCATTPRCEANNKTAELNYFFEMGADSVFVENVAEGREILLMFENGLTRGQERLAAGGAAGKSATFSTVFVLLLSASVASCTAGIM